MNKTPPNRYRSDMWMKEDETPTLPKAVWSLRATSQSLSGKKKNSEL